MRSYYLLVGIFGFLGCSLCMAKDMGGELPAGKKLVNSIGMELVRIEPGKFRMGAGDLPLPQHQPLAYDPLHGGSRGHGNADVVRLFLRRVVAWHVDRVQIRRHHVTWNLASPSMLPSSARPPMQTLPCCGGLFDDLTPSPDVISSANG